MCFLLNLLAVIFSSWCFLYFFFDDRSSLNNKYLSRLHQIGLSLVMVIRDNRFLLFIVRFLVVILSLWCVLDVLFESIYKFFSFMWFFYSNELIIVLLALIFPLWCVLRFSLYSRSLLNNKELSRLHQIGVTLIAMIRSKRFFLFIVFLLAVILSLWFFGDFFMNKDFFIVFIFILLIVIFPLWCFLRFFFYSQSSLNDKYLSRLHQIGLTLMVVIMPIIWLSLSSGFIAIYQGEKGYSWFYHIHDGAAGLTLLPIYIIASFSLGRAIWDQKYLMTSGTNFILVATLTIIATWYVYATLFLHLTKSGPGPESKLLAILPALAGLNYLAILRIILLLNRLRFQMWSLAAWWLAVAVSLWIKYLLAKDFYDKLPKDMPENYGECFIVSTAAQGHPLMVRSWIDPMTGQRINQQLRTFKAFEKMLAGHFPTWYRLLRRVYNKIGPLVAQTLRRPWQADIMYLLLKPLELLANISLQAELLWNQHQRKT